jgi:uncharacterized protein YraI
MRLRSILVAALLLAPTAALAAPGIVTVSDRLARRAGFGFPVVDRIPEGARVNIHGCLRGNAWCDVSFSDDRGWVSSQYLEYLYRNHYVYLPTMSTRSTCRRALCADLVLVELLSGATLVSPPCLLE